MYSLDVNEGLHYNAFHLLIPPMSSNLLPTPQSQQMGTTVPLFGLVRHYRDLFGALIAWKANRLCQHSTQWRYLPLACCTSLRVRNTATWSILQFVFPHSPKQCGLLTLVCTSMTKRAPINSRSWQHLLEIPGKCCEQHIKHLFVTHSWVLQKNQNYFRKGTRASNHDPSHRNLLSQRKDSTRRCLEGPEVGKPHKMPPHPVHALPLSHKNTEMNFPTWNRTPTILVNHRPCDSFSPPPHKCTGCFRRLEYICHVIISQWRVGQHIASAMELT